MRKICLLAIVLLLALSLSSCGALLQRPLGPELQLTIPPTAQPAAAQTQPTEVPAATEPPAAEPAETQPSAAETQPVPVTAEPSSTEPAEAETACNGEGQMDLLILGQAAPETPGQRGADAIRLVHVDFDQTTASNLSLPPDLLASESTLTQAYWLGLNAAQGDDPARHQQATQALAQTLLDSYGYAPDHYIDLNQPGFATIIDTLGGLVIDIPEDITDVPPGWHTFQAGLQTLTGDQVLDYVRLLNPTHKAYTSEWDRFDRQNQVIWAALIAVLDPANWDKLPALIAATRDMLVTDLSVDQLLDLACILEEAGGQAEFLVVPLDSSTTDEQGRIIIDPNLIRDLIADLQEE